MLDYLVVLLGPACYYWLTRGQDSGLTLNGLSHAGLRAVLPALAPLLFAAVALVVGLRRRTHAPLLAVALCLVCVGYELRDFTGLALYLRLILCGSVLLAAAILLERYLRTPRRGITSRPLDAPAGLADLLQLAGAASLTPQPQATAPYRGGGGGFGGGGASGEF
jgi:hypothetical protein